jgi:hypothetical protein
MKNPIRQILALAAVFTVLLAVLFAVASPAAAQEAAVPALATAPADLALAPTVTPAAVPAAPAAQPLTWVQAVIAFTTPLVIAGVKLVVPRIPRLWLPFLAPVVGLLIDVVAHLSAGTALNPTVALALGAAGVGLREAVNQIKKTALGEQTPATPAAP